MKFTRYFACVLKEHGTPEINPDYYGSMLNIIILENKIELLEKLQLKVSNYERKHYLTYEVFQLKSKLDRLTMENTPQNLLKYMLNETKSDF